MPTSSPTSTPSATRRRIIRGLTPSSETSGHLRPLAYRHGRKPGDHVAIWATNVPQWYITFWATVKIGAVLVTVNTAYKIHEAEYLLRQSDTHTLVIIDGFKDSNYVEIIKEICPELRNRRPHAAALPQAFALPAQHNHDRIQAKRAARPWDDAMAIHTSAAFGSLQKGTPPCIRTMSATCSIPRARRAFPKGVMLTHYNVVNNGKTIGDGLDLSADKMMIQVPMFQLLRAFCSP